MTSQLEFSLIRILNDYNKPVGAGFLVSNWQVVTCAHVVATALPGNPEGGQLLLDFPLLPDRPRMEARVVLYETASDIAGLELLGDLPTDARPGRLLKVEDLWGHSFRAFGFPSGYDNGVWASGRIMAKEATGLLQIEDVKQAGYFVQRGFSGGPIWDDELQGIVGMVVVSDTSPGIKAAFCIPVQVLIDIWPIIKEQSIPPCPYKGLFAFREQDATLFFGRKIFTDKLVQAVRTKSLVAVIGPSGSGKSSIIFAGLVPLLRSDSNYAIVDFRPGKDPFGSLAKALLILLEPEMTETDRLKEISNLAKSLQINEVRISYVVERLLQKCNPARKLLLIADQFEELYTLLSEDKTELRKRFIDVLLECIKEANNLTLVIGLRADFLGQVLAYRPFADALQDNDLKLGPMNIDELRQAIEQPAKTHNVTFESGLVERLLDDVLDRPGCLPLLEFALTMLWDLQDNGHLTHAAYNSIDHVDGALARYADEIFDRLTETEQEQARRAFIQMVSPGAGTEDTRRQATRNEIDPMAWFLVERLASARLVVTDQTPSGEGIVEIVHEALITNWGQLRGWMAVDRKFRAWQERLRASIRQWESSRRDDGALLRGAPLVEAEDWLYQRGPEMREGEREYVQMSVALRAKEETKREEQREREFRIVNELATTQSRAARRFRRLAIILGLVLVSAAILGLIVVLQGRNLVTITAIAQANQTMAAQVGAIAERDRESAWAEQTRSAYAEAVAQAAIATSDSQAATAVAAMDNAESESMRSRIARADFLASQSIALIPAEPLLSPLLAAEAISRTIQAGDLLPLSLLRAFIENQSQLGRSLLNYGSSDWVNYYDDVGIAFSPDSRWLAIVGMPEGVINLYDFTSRLDHGPLGRDGGMPAGVINLYDLHDLTTLTSPVRLKSRISSIRDIKISNDGQWLFACGDNLVLKWNLWGYDYPPKATTLYIGQKNVNRMTLSEDSRWLLVDEWSVVDEWGEGGRKSTLLDLNNPQPSEEAFPIEWFDSKAFSPDGRWLVAGRGDKLWLWDLTTKPLGPPRKQIVPHDYINDIGFSPDGEFLAIAGDLITSVWQIDPQGTLTGPYTVGTKIHEHQLSDVNDVAFSPDSSWLVTVSSDHTGRYTYLGNIETEKALSDYVFEERKELGVIKAAFNNSFLATGGRDNLTYLYFAEQLFWDEESRPRILRGHNAYGITQIAFSPDGRWMVTADEEGEFRLWNPGTLGTVNLLTWGYLFSSAVSGDRRWLAIGHQDKLISVFDLQAPDPGIASRQIKADEVTNVALSQDGRWLAAISGDQLVAWDLSQVNAKEILRMPDFGGVYSLAFSPDMRWLTVEGRELQLINWTSEGPGVKVIELDDITSYSFNNNGEWLATGHEDGSANLWDLRNNREPSSPRVLSASSISKDVIIDLVFDPMDRWLAGISDYGIVLWNLSEQGYEEEPLALSLTEDGVINTAWYHLAFSPDGRWLAAPSLTGSQGKKFDILVWSTQTLAMARASNANLILADIILPGPPECITSLAFSQDGHWLAIGTERSDKYQSDTSSSVLIYDMTSSDPGSSYTILKGIETYSIHDLIFSQNGRWLFARQLPNAFLLPMQPKDQYHMLCQLVRANLSSEEWRRYFPGQLYHKICPRWPVGGQ